MTEPIKIPKQKRLAAIDVFEQSIVATVYEGGRTRRKFIEPADAVEIFLQAGSRSAAGVEWMEYGPGVVRQGVDRNGDIVIWYHRQAKKTEVAVKIGSRKKPETFRLTCPHLLARLTRRAGRWTDVTHVYAFSGRLRKSTMLYLPPFPNVYGDGAVCMGSVSTNAAAGMKAGEYFEQAFIQSLFSDHFIGDPLRAQSGYRNILDAIRKRKGRISLSLLRKGGTYGRLCK